MGNEFEALANEEDPVHDAGWEGIEPDIFNMVRTMVGDQRLSKFQAQQLHEDLKASYEVYEDDTQLTDESLSVNLRDEVFQQMNLLRALRKELFFRNGMPRPDTEASEIRGYLSSSLQLLNLLNKFEDALKTDADVRVIEAAVEEALAVISEHPDSTVARDFIAALTTELNGPALADVPKLEELPSGEED